jgi:hypothetical protein
MERRRFSTFGLALVLSLMGSVPIAMAHPTGPVVSIGSNPVRSSAGVIDLGATSTVGGVITAPGDQDLVLTDIILGITVENDAARCSGYLRMEGSDGVLYGAYSLRAGRPSSDSNPGESRQFSGPTGIRIPAGISVSLVWVNTYRAYGSDTYNITYTLSGQLVQP